MAATTNIVPGLFRSAIAHHQAGRLVEAETIYRQILQRAPQHPETLYLLGLITYQEGKYESAFDLVTQAVAVDPSNPVYYNLLGSVLSEQGKLDEAINCYHRAISLKPDFSEAHNNLGNSYQKQGKLNDAAFSYRQAISLKPDYAKAYCNLGCVLQEQGNLNDAVASYHKAISLVPGYAEAHNFLGKAFMDMGRLEEAEVSYRRALKIKPGYADAHYNLGTTLRDLGRLDEALENFKLSLNAKNNWDAALRHLTTPLVLSTGLVLDSRNDSPHAEACQQTTSGARQGLPLQDAGYSEEGDRKKLRIILIYPPPWQIPSADETLLGMPFGLPRERNDRDLGGDFRVIPYGLLTIAAQAKRAGHDVSLHNLSMHSWQEVIKLIAESEADVYGLSAFTSNRRGLGAVAALIRQHHPQAHITAGGPFVTALPLDTLRYFRDIDTAVIGEGEDTFMELLECLGAGRPAEGIPGTAWRNGEEVVVGPARARIDDLDALASPFDYFASNIVITSRGCPSKCTFCGSFTTWGKRLRFHSAAFCLDTFKKALARLPVPFIAIKDDTFTAHRQRAIEICDAIIENKMNFLWSCDTRVDCLDDELLCKMRLAGCQMISLGVESGSPEILKSIRKETTTEMVLAATRSAQKYGMDVRYYMMLLNRGETSETIQQSTDLIKSGRPSRYFFGPLAFFPGTEEWEILRDKQELTPEIFFRNDFKELTVATNRQKEFHDLWLHVVCDIGSIDGFNYSTEEREAIVSRLPDLHSVHVELANAYFLAGRLDEAASELNRAEELGFPIGNIIENQRACISLASGEVDNALALLERALHSCPDSMVMKNFKILRTWADAPLNSRGKPPVLNSSIHAIDFQLFS